MKISDLITPAYHPIWADMRRFGHDTYWMNGGRGSGKSTIACARCGTGIIRDPMCNVIVYKKHQVEIETSVFSEFYKLFSRVGWLPFFKFTTHPHEITYIPTGQKIFFRGLDEAGKSKGITAKTGYLQIAWFEEYDQFAGQREIDTTLQSIGRGGPRFQVICTYNPPETIASWVNVEANKYDPHRMLLTTTYKDWRADWLGQFFFNTMERIRRNDEMRYLHEYEGKVTGTGGAVFRRVEVRKITDDERRRFTNIGWGMDFGQADPTTLVGSHYDTNTETIYVFSEWGKSDALNREVYDALRVRKLERAQIFGDVGGGGKGVMHELRELGIIGLVGAYKPKESVTQGTQWLRGKRIVIDADCPHTANEILQYEFVKLPDGTFRNEFPDYNNHFIDALRYSRQNDIFRSSASRLLI